jgi:glucan phosphoethanolaminetransferase (alkaline phosphatase superfamily)
MERSKLLIVLACCVVIVGGIAVYYKNQMKQQASDEEKALIFANYVEARNRIAAGDMSAQAELERIMADADQVGISNEELEEALDVYTAE